MATVTGYTEQEDYTVVLHLIVGWVHDHDFEEAVWNVPMNMTIRPTDGVCQIISNVPAE